jgi:hypothetical protein
MLLSRKETMAMRFTSSKKEPVLVKDIEVGGKVYEDMQLGPENSLESER